MTDAFGTPFNFITTRGAFAIPYVELMDGYGEGFNPQQQQSSRVCCCKWDQRFKFVADMVGYGIYQPGTMVAGVTSNLSRAIPDLHPECDFLFCTGCELIEGIGTQLALADYGDICKAMTNSIDYETAVSSSPNNNAAYLLAKYRCHYEALPYSVYSDAGAPSDPLSLGTTMGELSRYIQREPQPSAENLKLPGGQLEYPDGTSINEPGAQPVPTMEMNYVWHQVPVLPWEAIRRTVGKVNDALFDPTYFAAEPETILCNAPAVQVIRTAAGYFNYKITYKFSYRPNYAPDGTTAQGWNYFYRRNIGGSGVGGYDGPVRDRTDHTTRPFKSVDFNQLFVLPGSGGYG